MIAASGLESERAVETLAEVYTFYTISTRRIASNGNFPGRLEDCEVNTKFTPPGPRSSQLRATDTFYL